MFEVEGLCNTWVTAVSLLRASKQTARAWDGFRLVK